MKLEVRVIYNMEGVNLILVLKEHIVDKIQLIDHIKVIVYI